jgi:tRNA dimethylallyltransferase
MLDLVQPDEQYSVELYRREAVKVMRRIAARGRLAFVVGGTGFYVDALLGRMAPASVPPNPPLRERLRREAEDGGAERLFQRLVELDPASAARIHPNNLPRVVRALEIVDALGGPVPAPRPTDEVPALVLGLMRERQQLWEVADRRVLEQIEAGLIDETEWLLAMGYRPESPALQGFGYRQMVDYLQGRIDEAAAISQYQQATRQYIRRQMSWFRREDSVRWLEVGADLVERARRTIGDWLKDR